MEITYDIPDDVVKRLDAIMSEYIYTGSGDEQRLETVTEYIKWCLDNWFYQGDYFNEPDVSESVKYWLYEEKDINWEDIKLD